MAGLWLLSQHRASNTRKLMTTYCENQHPQHKKPPPLKGFPKTPTPPACQQSCCRPTSARQREHRQLKRGEQRLREDPQGPGNLDGEGLPKEILLQRFCGRIWVGQGLSFFWRVVWIFFGLYCWLLWLIYDGFFFWIVLLVCFELGSLRRLDLLEFMISFSSYVPGPTTHHPTPHTTPLCSPRHVGHPAGALSVGTQAVSGKEVGEAVVKD